MEFAGVVIHVKKNLISSAPNFFSQTAMYKSDKAWARNNEKRRKKAILFLSTRKQSAILKAPNKKRKVRSDSSRDDKTSTIVFFRPYEASHTHVRTPTSIVSE